MTIVRTGITRTGQVITGVIELEKALFSVRNAAPAKLAMGLRMEGERIMADAKQNYVPVVTGVLRASGRVHDVVQEGDTLLCRLSFGGPAASYALLVHEAPPERGQGKNKYLEKAVLAAAPHIDRRLADWVRVL